MKDELSQEARRLFATARASYSPEEPRIASVRAAIDAQIAAPVASGSEAHFPGGAGTAAGAAASPGIAGLGLVAAVLLAGGAALIVWRHQPAPTLTVQVATPPPALAVQQPPAVAAAAKQAPEPSPSLPTVNAEALPTAAPSSAQPLSALAVQARSPLRAHPSRKEAQAPAPVENAPAAQAGPDDSLARETSLLRSARAALDAGEAERALALLGRHAQLWPEGVLAEERLATKVLALCALGRVAQARETAGELESLAPASPHLARVRSSCARRSSTGGP
jgi:hypothetical protein